MVPGAGRPPAWLHSYPIPMLQAPQVSKHCQMPEPHASGAPARAPILQCALLHVSLSQPQPRGRKRGCDDQQRGGDMALFFTRPQDCSGACLTRPALTFLFLCPAITSSGSLRPGGRSLLPSSQSFNQEQLNFRSSKDLQGHLHQAPGLGRQVCCPHSRAREG